ncbi:MAG TPA: hypothetical protein VHP58_01015 [Alphaproteobacteria bacterium]|nr:hypothetical protein [Alphaproteobacteria bacterium]
MKNMTRFNLLLATAFAVLAPLAPTALEQSAVGGTGPTLLNNKLNSTMVNAGMDSIDARMQNIINCQKVNKLWNGTACVDINTGGPGGTVQMEVVMGPTRTVQANTPGPVVPLASGSMASCGFLDQWRCASNACQSLYTCSDISMYPDVNQVNGKLVITPKYCQTTLYSVPC